MTEITDLSFCDSCEHRGTVIGDTGSYCARTAMDNMVYVSRVMSGAKVTALGDASGETSLPIEEVLTSFGAEAMLDAMACIAAVVDGGEPIVDFED